MTLREVLEEFRRRRTLAEREAHMAPVAKVYATVLEDLEDVTLQPPRPRPGQRLPLIGATEAARRLGVDRSYLYRHVAELPFTVELPGGNYRYDPVRLEEYIARQGHTG